MQTRDQEYAARAYPLVQAVKEGKEKCSKENYRTVALNFPSMIMQSGLVQALGFLCAKGRDEHHVLLAHLAAVMGEDAHRLPEKVRQSDLVQYQLLSRKALEAASWLKRYSQALISD